MNLTETALPASRSRWAAAALVALAALAGCRVQPPAGSPVPTGNQAAVSALQAINASAHECWIRSKDPAFAGLRLIPELDTQYGRPRLLLLRKNSTQGLPVLVIEAYGNPARVETYGPLAATPLGNRIGNDVRRWSAGTRTCAA